VQVYGSEEILILTASKTGYNTQSKTVVVKANQTTTVNFELTPNIQQKVIINKVNLKYEGQMEEVSATCSITVVGGK
jgi:hypothetical protein